MRQQVAAFRNAAVQMCHTRKFPFADFMDEHGLEDILEKADDEDWSSTEIASQVLFQCCVTDGKFNNFQVGLLTVMTFLNVHVKRLGDGEQQAFQDLVSILRIGGTLEAIRGWMKSHY